MEVREDGARLDLSALLKRRDCSTGTKSSWPPWQNHMGVSLPIRCANFWNPSESSPQQNSFQSYGSTEPQEPPTAAKRP
eukprot:CAMPEP_0198562488 /NCGR_PEP_ID=MMETSP1462-20131121/97243_1 /TAXON_ID=1333877 /ORGANISM="Brandtodinium nutriculum, Strain RCC3387" /LENGTH=78 /DNA_ID=CAMNT_0044293417 /DNA_START=13 /DNA_END=246 /DNA_ORIENTATION=-